MYTKLLKDLNKGNAVLLEVNCIGKKSFLPRYRLVTANSCEYSMLFSAFGFSTSCFMWRRFNMNAKSIVFEMQYFDEAHHYEIKKLTVI
jgi:hypothetical protein